MCQSWEKLTFLVGIVLILDGHVRVMTLCQHLLLGNVSTIYVGDSLEKKSYDCVYCVG